MAALAGSLRKPLRPLWLSPASRIWINAVPHPTELSFLPLLLLSASAPVPASAAHQPVWRAARLPGVERTFSYCYVPGGGDDEESWARGLTPELLWAHRGELVAAGPEGIAGAVDAIVAAAARSAGAARLAPLPTQTNVLCVAARSLPCRLQHLPSLHPCAPAVCPATPPLTRSSCCAGAVSGL